jgi:hypothetical protein
MLGYLCNSLTHNEELPPVSTFEISACSSTDCAFVFRMIIRINIGYFLEYQPAGFCDLTQRASCGVVIEFFKYYLGKFSGFNYLLTSTNWTRYQDFRGRLKGPATVFPVAFCQASDSEVMFPLSARSMDRETNFSSNFS